MPGDEFHHSNGFVSLDARVVNDALEIGTSFVSDVPPGDPPPPINLDRASIGLLINYLRLVHGTMP